MTKMVRKHLSKKHVIQEEDLLEKIADSTDRSMIMWSYCCDVIACDSHVTINIGLFYILFYHKGFPVSCHKHDFCLIPSSFFHTPLAFPVCCLLCPLLVVQLRKNPPSPLNRGKRISGTKEKYRKSYTTRSRLPWHVVEDIKKFPHCNCSTVRDVLQTYMYMYNVCSVGTPLGPSISPSPTTGSFGSGELWSVWCHYAVLRAPDV